MTLATKAFVLTSSILLLFVTVTDPRNLPSSLLVLPFVFIFLALLFGCVAIFEYFGLRKDRRLKFASFVAAVPLILLVLQSLGQLTVRDALVLLVLFGVAYFYVSRFGLNPAK